MNAYNRDEVLLHKTQILHKKIGIKTGKKGIKMEDDEDICGLCNKPGADKYAHPIHWPGERIPNGVFVHSFCEDEEFRRAHGALSDEQRRQFLRSL